MPTSIPSTSELYLEPACAFQKTFPWQFDDIQSAAYQNPGLTTVRQPLREMGRIAAETVLRRINRPGPDLHGAERTVEPELIVRGTTCAPNGIPRSKKS
jgi:LacI family transcriptional regulator